MISTPLVTGRGVRSSSNDFPNVYSHNRVRRTVPEAGPERPLPFHGAGDAGGDGVEQALEFGLGRCGDVVETGLFVIERAGAIDEEHVQVDVGSAPSRIAG